MSDWSSDVCSSDLMRLVAEAALVGDVGNALAGIQRIAERQQALAQAALAHVMLHAAEALELTVELAARDEQLADDGVGRQRLAMQVLFDVVPDPARQVFPRRRGHQQCGIRREAQAEDRKSGV